MTKTDKKKIKGKINTKLLRAFTDTILEDFSVYTPLKF